MSSFFGDNKIARTKLLCLPNGIILKDLFLVWNIYPSDCQFIGSRLMGMDSYRIKQELDFIIHFLPLHQN